MTSAEYTPVTLAHHSMDEAWRWIDQYYSVSRQCKDGELVVPVFHDQAFWTCWLDMPTTLFPSLADDRFESA